MNDQTEIDTGTSLALPNATGIAALFASETGVDDIVAKIEAEAKAQAQTLTTDDAKGRKAIASLAYKIAQSKTALDNAGKALNEDKRAQIAAVDAHRRALRDRLDALKTQIRDPLDRWEVAEAERVEKHKAALETFNLSRADANSTAEQVRHVLDDVQSKGVGAEWDEFQPIAEAKKASAVSHFAALLASAEQRDRDAAELVRLRAEADERARKDAEEAALREAQEAEAARKAEADRIAAEKAEADRIAAERAEAAKIEAEKAEAARREQAERDRAEAIERARIEAQEAAKKAAAEADARHARELAEAKAREEAAAQRERDRITAERKAEADARAKREADQAHRARIRNEIADGLKTLEAGNWFALADALIDGKVPHCEVRL